MSEIQIEKLDGLARKVAITLPISLIQQDKAKRLQQIAKGIRKDGFRPGKVPMHIVEKEYGQKALLESQYDKVNQIFINFSKDKDLQIAGSPEITPKQNLSDDLFGFDVTFEVYPEFLIQDLSQCELNKYSCEVGDSEINKTIDVLRNQYVEYKDTDENHQAQDGDKVTIDFEGKIDSEIFKGGSANNYSFTLGEKKMLPEFETGILGLKAGESKEVEVNFPPDYQGKEVAGKTAVFTIKLNKIETAVLPELNDDFVKKVGVDGGIDKLKQDVKANLDRETKRRTFGMLKQQVLDILLEKNPIEAPSALVKDDQARQLQSLKQDLIARGMKNIDQLPYDIEMFKESSEKRVKLGLILAQLVKQHNLQVTNEQIKTQIEEFAQNYEDPKEVMRWYYQDSAKLEEMKAYVLENNVVDFVSGIAKITDKNISFEELSQQQSAE